LRHRSSRSYCPGNTVAERKTLEISVAVAGGARTSSSVVSSREDVVDERLMRAATRPLLARDLVSSDALTGRELFHPRGMDFNFTFILVRLLHVLGL
jgi:hypothetical protein